MVVLVLHIVLFVDGPHLKSVTLVTLQAVKLESDNVVFLFLALESSSGDLMALEDLVMEVVVLEELVMEVMVMEDLVMKDPARSVEWNGIRFASEFSSSHLQIILRCNEYSLVSSPPVTRYS